MGKEGVIMGSSSDFEIMKGAIDIISEFGVDVEYSIVSALLSIVQMPSGVPVATVAIGNSKNAGLLALRILSIKYDDIAIKLSEFREDERIRVMNEKLQK